jgi:hypothetical protein
MIVLYELRRKKNTEVSLSTGDKKMYSKDADV